MGFGLWREGEGVQKLALNESTLNDEWRERVNTGEHEMRGVYCATFVCIGAGTYYRQEMSGDICVCLNQFFLCHL